MKTLDELADLFTQFTSRKTADAPQTAEKAPDVPAAPVHFAPAPAAKAATFTAEALASSKSVMMPTRGGTATGLQFIPTPPEAAQLAAAVFGPQPLPVFDLTAGDGAFLAPFAAYNRCGAEIDPQLIADAASKDRPYSAVQGDVQALYPLLRLSPLRFQRIVLNPPFGLTWQQGSVNGGQPASSTRISFEMALGLLSHGGQGALICGSRRLDEEILSVPALAKSIYFVLDCGKMFDGVDLDCSLVFFADPQLRREGTEESTPRQIVSLPGAGKPGQPGRDALAATVKDARNRLFRILPGAPLMSMHEIAEHLKIVQVEHTRRVKQAERRSGYDLEIHAGKMKVYLNPLAFEGLARAGSTYHPTGYQTLQAVQKLNGQHSSYFAQNGREWKWLSRLLADGLLTMDPADVKALAESVDEGKRAACPMYPLKPQQRLAYIDDLDALPCTLSDAAKGFTAGECYAVTVTSEIMSDEREEVKTDSEGTPHTHTFVSERKVLRITLTSPSGAAVVLRETKEDIEYLLSHFDVPDPGDLLANFPVEMESCLASLRDVEARIMGPRGFGLKNYQRDDTARMLLKGSGILALEQGLGKSVSSMAYAEALETRGEIDGNVLLIAPQDLVPQWQREAEKFFGRTLTHITTRAQAREISEGIRRGTAAPAWYITHYEALALTGTSGSVSLAGGEPVKTQQGTVKLPESVVSVTKTARDVPGYWEGYTWVPPTTVTDAKELTTKDLCPQCYAAGVLTANGHEWNGYTCKKCGYVHAALRLHTIAHDLKVAFHRGAIILDEGTKIKGDSQQSAAVRSLHGKRKLLLTGTPQKNYVNDLFLLIGWAVGFGTARFPFAQFGGKTKFENEFCVIEYKQGDNRRKILPEVTNLSVLWRLLSGVMVRRRKEQTGEPIVERTFVPVTVPMGEAQRSLYGKWLYGFAQWYREMHPEAKGDIDRFAAILGQLPKLNWASTFPAGDKDHGYWNVEGVSNWTPKTLKVLELAAHHASQGEKVLIGSDVMLTGRMLADALNAKDIPASHILEGDGANVKTKSPAKRASAIQDFQNGDTRVLCAGVQSIALGHNMDCASVVILTGLPWDYATLHQFIARVHRLSSTRPVTIYVILTAGSLDERKWQLLSDKMQSADLALDGELSERKQREVSMQEVLQELIDRGLPADEGNQTAKEADCKASWDAQTFTVKPLLGPLTPTPKADPEPEPEDDDTEFVLKLVTSGPARTFDTKNAAKMEVSSEVKEGLFSL